MASGEKQEAVFDLIKSMTKAEKRNFKLYATRLAGNQEAKFIALFDCLDTLEEYDEGKVLQKCPVKKEQLPNMKAHLYKQILVSLRLLGVQHSMPIQLREQLDFARILYDKGLYRQSSKILEKTREQASATQQHTILLDVIDFQKQIETLNVSRGMASLAESFHRQTADICRQIENINTLSSTALQIFSLYQKLGYVRTQKDLDLIDQYFRPRLAVYTERSLSFLERFYYFQAMAWFHYIRHDFVRCYLYACRWIALFDAHPQMKPLMYDNYLKGYSRLLEGLFLMRKYHTLVDTLARFEKECREIGSVNENAVVISRQIIYTGHIHRCFLEGSFREGIRLVEEVETFLRKHSKHINLHQKMLMYYKIACLYFGDGNYSKCMEYLARITGTKDPQIRRDLQCYAKILNLIASYEAGIDYNLDYQIRSVYSFIVKMNDMQEVQREMLAFLKRLNSIYAHNLKDELRVLYQRLKPYENHPYERRTFYYLDILSWLESKITGRTVGEIIREKFRREQRKPLAERDV